MNDQYYGSELRKALIDRMREIFMTWLLYQPDHMAFRDSSDLVRKYLMSTDEYCYDSKLVRTLIGEDAVRDILDHLSDGERIIEELCHFCRWETLVMLDDLDGLIRLFDPPTANDLFSTLTYLWYPGDEFNEEQTSEVYRLRRNALWHCCW